MYGNRKKTAIVTLIVLLAVAAFFRLYRIGDIPLGINNDAAWEGSAARAIQMGNWKDYIPYAAHWHGEMIIRATVVALSPIVGNTPTTIKLTSSLYGILLIPILYIFLRKLFPGLLAFLTTWFVATSGWHVIMSRSGWRAVTVPTIITLVWLTMYQAVTTKKRLWYILAGCTVALTLYTYDAARVVPLVVLGAIGWMGYSSPIFRLRHKQGGALFFLSFILVASPMILYAVVHWDTFVGRTTYLLVTEQVAKHHSIQPLIDNVKTTAGLFTNRANGNDFFIDEPLLDPPIVWLFPIGIVLSLWGAIVKKNRRLLFMLGWFLVSLLPAVLSNPNGNRAIGTLPSVYFFAAYGTITVIEVVNQLVKKRLPFIRMVLVFYIAAFVAAAAYISYLGPVRKEPKGFYPETFITSRYLQTKLDTYTIYVADNFPREILTYMLYTGGDPFNEHYTWFPKKEYMLTVPTQANKGNLFVLLSTQINREFSEKLLEKNPGGRQFILPYTTDIGRWDAAIIVEVSPKK